MGIRYNLVESNTTDIPDNAGATTYSRGFNIPGGPIDEIILRVTLTTAASSILADFSNALQSLRLILNGETVHDFRSGYSDTSNNAPGLYGYFLNSLGEGRFVEIPSDTSKEAYFRIPIGRQLASGSIQRLEYTLAWSALQSAETSGTVQWWIRYNSAMESQVTVSASTSFSHAASEEQVIVRLPQNVPGTVAGVFIQNDSAADQLTGVRITSQSDFSVTPAMYQAFNGDLYNGILYADDDASTTQQTYAIQVAGGLFIPTFGLTKSSDLVLQVNSSAATTRTYTPVITAAVNAREGQGPVQTQAVPTSTPASIVAATTEQS